MTATIGTVYDCAYDLQGGKFVTRPYIAAVNQVGSLDEPRWLISSDLDAIRARMALLGLKRHPPHPLFDPNVILEVWFDD